MTAAPRRDGAPESEGETGLEEVLELVREREGVDLSAYRRNTIERRITSRLQKLRCQSYEEYATRLAEDPTESRRLLEHVTIKVSHFFRDAQVFTRLREDVLPALVSRAGSEGVLQFWSAGCGNGEELYSLAILVEELAREGVALPHTSLWGTDVDQGALAAAQRGVYAEDALTETPPELVATYFARQQGRFGPQYQLLPAGRKRTAFLQQNLLSGAEVPGSLPFDLILCRNVLIYFERPAQDQVLRLLTDHLAPGGYLCLGEAEQLSREYQSGFETIDRQARLYRKVQPPFGEEEKRVV